MNWPRGTVSLKGQLDQVRNAATDLLGALGGLAEQCVANGPDTRGGMFAGRAGLIEQPAGDPGRFMD